MEVNDENSKVYETKNLSSLKFNLKHMADAGTTSNNHGMPVKPNKCSAAIGTPLRYVFLFF